MTARKPSKKKTKDEHGTLELLENIKSKKISAKSLSPEDRRQIVAFMAGEGYSNPEMAKLLKVSDRTIERDRKVIRDGNAIEPAPEMIGQMVGRLMCEADLAVQQIRKTLRDKDASPAVKVDGNHRCCQILSDLTHDLQGLGYLPTAAQKIEADFGYYSGELPSLDHMKTEVKQLELIVSEAIPGADEAKEQLRQLRQQIEQAELATKLEEISSNLNTQEHENDTQE